MINVNVLPPKQLAMLKFKLMPPFRGLEMGSSKTLHQPNTGVGRHVIFHLQKSLLLFSQISELFPCNFSSDLIGELF